MSDITTPNSSPTPPAAVPPVLELAAPYMKTVPTAAQKRLEVRIWCGFIFVSCAAMLAVGLWLTPDKSGAGTHQELGLPPCGLLQTTGIPCPTCGCTTAVSYLAHGHVVASFLTQPFGFVVGLLAVILVPLTLVGVITGLWRGPSMWVLGWHWRYWTYGSLALLLGAWVYKIIIVQMHVGF
jgi:hypothetical protein